MFCTCVIVAGVRRCRQSRAVIHRREHSTRHSVGVDAGAIRYHQRRDCHNPAECRRGAVTVNAYSFEIAVDASHVTLIVTQPLSVARHRGGVALSTASVFGIESAVSPQTNLLAN